MALVFYTDPHLGSVRRENHTERSLQRREELALEAIQSVTSLGPSICLGDLFDKATNPEKVILSGLIASETTDMILAGNHDLFNREGAVSSLDLLAEAVGEKVCRGHWTVRRFDEGFVVLVPHQRTQAEFDEQLQMAEQWALKQTGAIFLGLHCNYDNALIDKEHELVLSRERAEQLLKAFTFILIGHEHAAADYFDGRLRIVGSLLPTSFSDAAAKHRALVFSDGEFSEIDTSLPYYKGPASRAPSHVPNAYVELEDDLPAGETARLAVELFAAGALAVKVKSTIKETPAYVPQTVLIKTFEQAVSEFLSDLDDGIKELWNEFLKADKEN